MDDRRTVGAAGEAAARAHLIASGWAVLATNVRLNGSEEMPGLPGELDIVARDGSVLVFVEVKARRGRVGDVLPEVSVSAGKRRQIARLATAWLGRHGFCDGPSFDSVRFDVVSVVLDSALAVRRMVHRRGAFTTDDLETGWDN